VTNTTNVPSPRETISVEGRVFVPASAQAFDGGVLHVKLEDVSNADGPSTVLSEASIPGIAHEGGAATIVPFKISPPTSFNAGCEYRVSAWLNRSGDGRRGDRDLWSDRRYPVLTHGHGSYVTIFLAERS
jgi:uncharacterized lipoprotein YbaY